MRDGKVVWVALFCGTIPCLENLTKRSLRIVLFERRCGTGPSSIVSGRGRYVNRRLFLSSSLGVENEDPADRRGLRIVLFERRCGTGRDGQVSSPEGDDTSIVGCSCLHLSAWRTRTRPIDGDFASSSSRDDAGRDGTVKYRLPKGTIRQSSVVLVFISRRGERGPGR